jgi:two-component system nitrogen regulation response regulator NtrX
MATILIIDDEENIRKTVREILEDEEHEVLVAEDGEQGIRRFREEAPDVVLLDIQMPKKDGMEILSEIKESRIDCEVIMISGHGTIELAVSAIKQGAYHFLQKPLSMIEVRQIVRHAADAKASRDELRTIRQQDDDRYRMIGSSAAMQKLRTDIAKVAPSAGRILIRGESGTGKELVAWAIHRQSSRNQGPFVKVNCAAIPQNLIESELFGYEKGAFTGATGQKKGKFELAHRGTLLLDEIGDMDFSTQTKVLRVIQEGELERVGGTKIIKIDVRIVAATHRDLEAMLAEGKFREDLYYRLAVLPIIVPSLEQRIEDLPQLAEFFLGSYCKETGMPPKSFASEALGFIAGQKFPGNIRQLRNIVERAAIMSTTESIDEPFMQSLLGGGGERRADANLFTAPRPLQQAKDELERTYVETQLRLNGWNIAKTAEILGIERPNLHRKIKQLGIEKAG